MKKLTDRLGVIAKDLEDANQKTYAKAIREALDERERVLNSLRELMRNNHEMLSDLACTVVGEMIAAMERR